MEAFLLVKYRPSRIFTIEGIVDGTALISSFSSRHDCSRRANLIRILFDKLTDSPVF